MNQRKKHVVVRLATRFTIGVWSILAALGAILVAPLLAAFEVPAIRRYARMRSM